MTWSRRVAWPALVAALGLAGGCSRAPEGFDLTAGKQSLAAPSGFDFGSVPPRTGRLEVDTEMRPVVFVAGRRWSWRGRVPSERPFLHAGVQIAPEAWSKAGGFSMRVEAIAGAVREVLDVAETKSGERQRWLDVDVDLSPYAGRVITLEFIGETRGGED